MIGSSGQVRMFHCNKSSGIETYVSMAVKSNPAIRQHGSPTFAPSVRGVVKDIGGLHVHSSYEIEDGEVLKVFVKMNYGYGKIEFVGSFFIRVRDGASYRRIFIDTLQNQSLVFRQAKIEGCFDLLTAEKAEKLGVKVKPEYRHLYQADFSKKMKMEVLIPEDKITENKKVIMAVDETTGKAQPVLQLKRRRAVEL